MTTVLFFLTLMSRLRAIRSIKHWGMAKELLELTIYGLEEDGEPVPAASIPVNIKVDLPGAFVTLVAVDMPMVRAGLDLQYIRKTGTVLTGR